MRESSPQVGQLGGQMDGMDEVCPSLTFDLVNYVRDFNMINDQKDI